MSILILNKIPYEKVPYGKWLSELNENIILFNDSNLTDYNSKWSFITREYNNYIKNEDIKKDAFNINKERNINKIIALSEIDMIRAAEIREKLNIEGQSVFSANVFRNKLKMKELLYDKDFINIPKYLKITDMNSLIKFVSSYGYPIVIKPCEGFGSKDITIISNDEELDCFEKDIIENDIMVESYIEGDMYHIDGIVIDNKMVFCWPSKYINGCLAFKEGNYLGSYVIDKESSLRKRLVQVTSDIIKVFPTPKNTTFHLELFHTPKDEIYFCEIASRTGGARVNEVIKQCFNINLTKLWVLSECNILNRNKLKNEYNPIKYKGFFLIPPQSGELIKIPKKLPFEYVTEYIINKEEGYVCSNPQTSVDNILSVIVEGESPEEVVNRIEECVIWLRENVIWKREKSNE